MEFTYTYYLGTPETEQSISFREGKKKWKISRNEDWILNGWLSYEVRVPGKKTLRLFMYEDEYDMVCTTESQDDGMAFDELETFFKSSVAKLYSHEHLTGFEVSLKGGCGEEHCRRIEELYALLEGKGASARDDLQDIANKTGRRFDIESCLSDMKISEDCYRQRLFDSVYRTLY